MAQDLRGRTFLITGASSGIGRATAVELGRRGGKLFLATRNEEKTKPLLDELGDISGNSVEAEHLHLDLGDLDSVRQCAKDFLSRDEPLHVLINNAGLAGQRGLTTSGFELAFGTNHVGHFLLTNLLLDNLRANAPSRIVNVASVAHFSAPGIDYEAVRRPTRNITGLPEYAVSKLANVLHAQE
ncbi:MAG: SDR family NAD(P)-dependent oxidoreductase, partial [Acidimicrobiia bacterium]|nr:SDR family NAD(P)-dependent oxidoreductase [Acidimicrobiia bacterium]